MADPAAAVEHPIHAAVIALHMAGCCLATKCTTGSPPRVELR